MLVSLCIQYLYDMIHCHRLKVSSGDVSFRGSWFVCVSGGSRWWLRAGGGLSLRKLACNCELVACFGYPTSIFNIINFFCTLSLSLLFIFPLKMAWSNDNTSFKLYSSSFIQSSINQPSPLACLLTVHSWQSYTTIYLVLHQPQYTTETYVLIKTIKNEIIFCNPRSPTNVRGFHFLRN